MKLLLVEDDEILGDALNQSLIDAGYTIDWAKDGRSADLVLHDQIYDLVILDLGLPQLDGIEVLRRLRQRRTSLPVLVLSARDDTNCRVKALDLGADDYLTKPFKLPELEARLRAILRRVFNKIDNEIKLGSLTINFSERTVEANSRYLSFSKREYSVLELLLLKNGRVVSKEALVESLYNWSEEVGHNAIEVYIHRIRKKLNGFSINITNVSGIGYVLTEIKHE